MITAVFVICAMGYLTYLGAAAGSPNEIDMEVAAEYEPGKLVTAQSGCLACHKIGENGNDGPGPELTDIASRLPREAIYRSLQIGPGIMPSYADASPRELNEAADFLATLDE